MKGRKNFRVNKADGKLTITEERQLDIKDVESVEDAKQKLKDELRDIIREVKRLKMRAEEIKEILADLEE